MYVSDWFDPRVGGHSDLDDKLLGTIYRIAPKGFKTSAPKVDLGTAVGCLAALQSPAVNVRFTALRSLVGLGVKELPALLTAAQQETNPHVKARLM